MAQDEGDNKSHRTALATRQITAVVSGPLAGASILFLGGMLTLGKGALDEGLTRALFLFAVSIPFLLLSFLFALLEAPGWNAFVALWIGIAGLEGGIFYFVRHLSEPGANAFLVAIAACSVWFLVLVRMASRRERIEAAKAKAEAKATKAEAK